MLKKPIAAPMLISSSLRKQAARLHEGKGTIVSHHSSFARSLDALTMSLHHAQSYESLDACALALSRLGMQITAALELAAVESREPNAA